MSRQHSPTSTRFAVTIVAAAIAIAPFALLVSARTAQADITDYAVFGNVSVSVESTAPKAARITGAVGSNGSVFLSGGVFIAGPVQTRGDVFADGGAHVTGNIVSNGTVFLQGADAAMRTLVTGNVDTGDPLGGIFVGPYADVTGTATATSAGSVYLFGDGTVGAIGTGTPATFAPVALPRPATFSAGGSNVTDAYLLANGPDLAPGRYGDVILGSGQVLNLTSGNYFFQSFEAASNLLLNLDLNTSTPGVPGFIGIYVVGDVFTGDGLRMTLAGGGPENVYSQTNGLAGWNTLSVSEGAWFGTIYAPYGNIALGSNFNLSGAIYGNSISMLDGSVVEYHPIDFSNVIPAPGAILLGAIGLGLIGWLKRRV